jgi:hypothetical protein
VKKFKPLIYVCVIILCLTGGSVSAYAIIEEPTGNGLGPVILLCCNWMIIWQKAVSIQVDPVIHSYLKPADKTVMSFTIPIMLGARAMMVTLRR